MKTWLVKSALALTCIALISATMLGQNGRGGGGGGSSSSSCAVVATPVLSTSTASPGINVGVFSRVGNCSASKKRYTVSVTALSSCGEETVIAAPVISFAGGEYKLISTTYAIAPDTCVGLSTITVSVSQADTLLSSASTTLTIQ